MTHGGVEAALQCPLCDGVDLEPVFRKKRAPRYLLQRHTTRDDALAAPTGDLDVRWCRGCSFAFNGAFDPASMDYVVDYESSRSHSEYFARYLDAVAAEIDRVCGVSGRTVVEIGCGDGHLLMSLRRKAKFAGWGFEPSMARTDHRPAGEDLQFVAELYRREWVPTKPDLLILRHVLEHQGGVRPFLRDILGAKGDETEQIYVEVPAWEWVIDHDQVHTLTYEHCNYFSGASLSQVMQSFGFGPRQVSFAFEDEYLQYFGQQGIAEPAGKLLEPGLRDSVHARTRAFIGRIPTVLDRVNSHFADPADTVLWGAAGKGTSLLNLLDIDHRRMPFVVDSNPRRHGTYVPVTGQEVVAPQALAQIKPARVLLTNPSYQREIEAQLASLGVEATVSVVR